MPTDFYRLPPRDRELMVALQMHEQSIHRCGHPVHISMSPDTKFTLEDDKCYACAMLEDNQKSQKDSEPGVSWRAVVVDEPS